jgi:hypothetical protein
MDVTAIYENPFDRDSTSKGGTRITREIRHHICSNTRMNDEAVKQILRRHLSKRFKIAEIKEEKIRIGYAFN